MNATVEPTTGNFSFLGLLDRTFRLYRENFATIVGIAAIVLIPLAVVQFLLSAWSLSSGAYVSTLSRAAATSEALGTSLVISIVSLVVSLIQAVVMTGAVTYAASESYLGRTVSIGQAFGARRDRFKNLGCGYIIFFILLFVLAFVIGMVGVLWTPAFAGLGVVLYVGIATYTFLSPVLILENVETPLGVNRSWSLGKARFWTAVALNLTLVLLTALLNLAFAGVAQVLVLAVTGTLATTGTVALNLILTTISNVFLAPLLPIGLTLLYHDSRNRLEGLDFALRALSKPDARPADIASPRPQGGFTSRDMINMGVIFGISLVFVLLASTALTTLIRSLTRVVPQ
jgi:hypothetical protein